MENQLMILEEKDIQKMLEIGNERLSEQEYNLLANLMKTVQKSVEKNDMQRRVIEKFNKELAIAKNTIVELEKLNSELFYREENGAKLWMKMNTLQLEKLKEAEEKIKLADKILEKKLDISRREETKETIIKGDGKNGKVVSINSRSFASVKLKANLLNALNDRVTKDSMDFIKTVKYLLGLENIDSKVYDYIHVVRFLIYIVLIGNEKNENLRLQLRILEEEKEMKKERILESEIINIIDRNLERSSDKQESKEETKYRFRAMMSDVYEKIYKAGCKVIYDGENFVAILLTYKSPLFYGKNSFQVQEVIGENLKSGIRDRFIQECSMKSKGEKRNLSTDEIIEVLTDLGNQRKSKELQNKNFLVNALRSNN
ncbi:hypothetical protein DICPUDRAFT_74574 [Dictyostelium purpureum]|uniref:Uncharacterized protein n=1 Tax=Dictyostelium purpureum TaxID=5786 RepID=F0Z851_DICPU|nr:uncharacterized protein DICPUDRAFT_74574 [Dictyostelium purpureum]EGC39835.1 hypothetical protein DICPUDRAFT_74574 [Dictyostelium purpureum]|eukprot:XP_003283586.1 hypothetical protein DICPUDRAFT_74574 [Dictyostelium purpureum]